MMPDTVATRVPAGPHPRPLKVCIFTETFHPVVGGGETQARILAQGLQHAGFEVFILTRRSAAPLARTERINGLLVRRLGPSGSGQLKKWGLLFTGLPALFRFRRDYDIVFVSGFRIIGTAAVIAARCLGKRVVLKADSQGEMSGEFFSAGLARIGIRVSSLPFRGFLLLRNAILRRADAFVAITSDVAAELRDARISVERMHRVPNAVDTGRFKPAGAHEKRAARARLGLPEHAQIAAYTGRLVSYKGLPLLLRAWQDIHERFPAAVLLLIGSGGLDIHSCENELKSWVHEHGLGSSVIFTGSVDNVQEYLNAADVFAFPTENDAFPSSLVEAMVSGLPVVTTPVGAIPEIVTDGENGLLVPPRDHDALLGALTRVLLNPESAALLGRRGWSTVQERYSADRVTRAYAEIFHGLTREHA